MAPRYSFVVCKSTGEPVGEALAAKGRQITRTLNQPATATLSLQLGDVLAPFVLPGTGRLKVYRAATPQEVQAGIGKTLIFYGSLPTTGLTMDAASDTLTAVYRDPRWVLERRFAVTSLPGAAPTSFTAVLQGTMLQNLVYYQNNRASDNVTQNGETWIKVGTDTTVTVRDRTYIQQQVSQLFDDMTKVVNGCDVDIVPFDYYTSAGTRHMGSLRTYERQGADQSNAVFAYGPGTTANITNASLSYQEVTTIATVTGSDANGLPVIGTYGTPVNDGLGMLEDLQSDPDVSAQATVNEKARGIINEQSTLRPIITIDTPLPDAPRALVDYNIGDTVRVQIKRGVFLYSGSPRVHDILIDIDQDGFEKIGITMAA